VLNTWIDWWRAGGSFGNIEAIWNWIGVVESVDGGSEHGQDVKCGEEKALLVE